MTDTDNTDLPIYDITSEQQDDGTWTVHVACLTEDQADDLVDRITDGSEQDHDGTWYVPTERVEHHYHDPKPDAPDHDEAMRIHALNLAVTLRSFEKNDPDSLVKAAAIIENYILNGVVIGGEA